jgi:sugar phosphate permease
LKLDPLPVSADPPPDPSVALTNRRRYVWLGTLILGYIGIYLCRKNFSVAIPILQEHFSATRAELGLIASYSTIAYAAGKFFFGTVVDRIGGRAGFFGSMLLVAVLGWLQPLRC